MVILFIQGQEKIFFLSTISQLSIVNFGISNSTSLQFVSAIIPKPFITPDLNIIL